MIEIHVGVAVWIAFAWFMLGAYFAGGAVFYILAPLVVRERPRNKLVFFAAWPLLWLPMAFPGLFINR